MKKIFEFAIIILLVFSLFSCGAGNDEAALPTFSTEELNKILDTSFSPEPYVTLAEGLVELNEQELSEIISLVPKDKYEHYPELQIVPSKATL